MALTSATLINQELTNIVGNWSSGPIAAGAYDTLVLDIILTEATEATTMMISRLDAFNNPSMLWGASTVGPTNQSIDIGPCDAYEVSRAWAGNVQVDILNPGTIAGTVSLMARG